MIFIYFYLHNYFLTAVEDIYWKIFAL